MNEETLQFKATLELLIPLIIKEIVKQRDIPQEEAFVLLYSSKLYKLIEDEETKLWHLSPLTLFNLLAEELETGKISFPQEA
jgi:hypothetical protein